MKVNTEITNKSWGAISGEKAKDYLHNYPRKMKESMAKFISSIANPKILDIGCGNAQIYPILKKHSPTLDYTGVDITDVLIEAARDVVGDNGKIIKDDIFNYITNTREKYDFAILSHMLECVESPDLLMGEASKACDYICIHWYDTPKYKYDVVTIAKNPHSGDTFNPYLRRKMGKDYWAYIVRRHGLKLVHRESAAENNVLEVYKKNDLSQ